MIYRIELQKKRIGSKNSWGKTAIRGRVRLRPFMAKVFDFVFFNLSLQMLMMIQMSLSADPDIEGQWHRAPGRKTKMHPIGQNGTTNVEDEFRKKTRIVLTKSNPFPPLFFCQYRTIYMISGGFMNIRELYHCASVFCVLLIRRSFTKLVEKVIQLPFFLNIARIANAVHVTLWMSVTNPHCHGMSFSICQK